MSTIRKISNLFLSRNGLSRTVSSCAFLRSRSFMTQTTDVMDPDIVRRTLVSSQNAPKCIPGRVGLDYPRIEGTSEIHIFLNPLNPDRQLVEKYDRAVEEFNTNMIPDRAGAITPMRPVFLCLNFRDLGDVYVMQSARHIKSRNPDYVIEEAYNDGKWFADRGFEVIRHKIEAFGGTQGVPLTDQDAESYPARYWEFHLRVTRAGDAPDQEITQEEIQSLKELSESYTNKWQVPVPLSYNAYKSGTQRFLNFRIGFCGKETAVKGVEHIKRALESSDKFEYLHMGKAHIEYVWYDDNRDMDRGWIDFTADEHPTSFASL